MKKTFIIFLFSLTIILPSIVHGQKRSNSKAKSSNKSKSKSESFKSIYQLTLEQYILKYKGSPESAWCVPLDTLANKSKTLYLYIDTHDIVDTSVMGYKIICFNNKFNWGNYVKSIGDNNIKDYKQDVIIISPMRIERNEIIMSIGAEILTLDKEGNQSFKFDAGGVCPTYKFYLDPKTNCWTYKNYH